jgi:hypothetical protein
MFSKKRVSTPMALLQTGLQPKQPQSLMRPLRHRAWFRGALGRWRRSRRHRFMSVRYSILARLRIWAVSGTSGFWHGNPMPHPACHSSLSSGGLPSLPSRLRCGVVGVRMENSRLGRSEVDRPCENPEGPDDASSTASPARLSYFGSPKQNRTSPKRQPCGEDTTSFATCTISPLLAREQEAPAPSTVRWRAPATHLRIVWVPRSILPWPRVVSAAEVSQVWDIEASLSCPWLENRFLLFLNIPLERLMPSSLRNW